MFWPKPSVMNLCLACHSKNRGLIFYLNYLSFFIFTVCFFNIRSESGIASYLKRAVSVYL